MSNKAFRSINWIVCLYRLMQCPNRASGVYLHLRKYVLHFILQRESCQEDPQIWK